MNYSCVEELQTILDLHMSNKTSVLSDAGCKYKNKWFVVTDDGHCHLFDKDGNLDDIYKVTSLEEGMIKKDIKKIIIPDTIVDIGRDAFYGCYCITSVMIPDSVTSIGYGAFSNCTNLTRVTIPDSITNIKYMTFRGCINLKNMTIPDSVTSIGDYAFSGCSGLTSVTIPDSVTSIDSTAFNKCNTLTNIIFKGKSFDQVKKMDFYPFGIENESIIKYVE